MRKALFGQTLLFFSSFISVIISMESYTQQRLNERRERFIPDKSKISTRRTFSTYEGRSRLHLRQDQLDTHRFTPVTGYLFC